MLPLRLIALVYLRALCQCGMCWQGNQEMVEHGRIQYQLLMERGSLPQYGDCWKAAVKHLDEGCAYLSEETQGDIALHITNCFLEMSGHITYNCELDRKVNLRAICINSMSDRAFNVYTEFYTHTQNICWFLKGQVWQEAIAENTVKVGRQLEVTAQNQEGLLKAQQESLELQEKMLRHGRYLEQVLEHLHRSSNTHRDILMLLTENIKNLQNWIMGEISWIDSIIFYVTTTISAFFMTSVQRAMSARLPIFSLLVINFFLERLICSTWRSSKPFNIYVFFSDMYNFIWYLRYAVIFLSLYILIFVVLRHRDLLLLNNEFLCSIKEDSSQILIMLENLKCRFNLSKPTVDITNESNSKSPTKLNYSQISDASYKDNFDQNVHACFENSVDYEEQNMSQKNGRVGVKEKLLNNNKNIYIPNKKLSVSTKKDNKYNLRNSSKSRQNTPDC